MISKETGVKIATLARDGLKPGSIAEALDLHHDTVKSSLEKVQPQKNETKPGQNRSRSSVIDAWLHNIDALLNDHPKIRATRIHDFLRGRGYKGSVYPIRDYCRQVRSHSHKAYLDLNFLPGEAAQVDWASFGSIKVGDSTRKLHVLIVVLAYSRRFYARFFHDMCLSRVLEGQIEAFEAFGGVPRKVVYDNMKTAVLEHIGTGVRFNSGLLDFAKHYAYEPVACNPRSGWEKGRVERVVRYMRESFFEARNFDGIDDLNRQLQVWLDGPPMERKWVDDFNMTVATAFMQEKLYPLPGDCYAAYEEKNVRVSKKAMVQFDSNRYPVNPEYVGQILVLRATHEKVRIISSGGLLHEYTRSWEKGKTLVLEGHQESIAKARGIKAYRVGRSALENTLDCGRALLERWGEMDENIQTSSRLLLELVKVYDRATVETACKLALENGTPRVCSIEQILAETSTVEKSASTSIHSVHKLPEQDIEWSSTESYDDLYNE